ncbi:hypothetical protein [Thermococcus sp.]
MGKKLILAIMLVGIVFISGCITGPSTPSTTGKQTTIETQPSETSSPSSSAPSTTESETKRVTQTTTVTKTETQTTTTTTRTTSTVTQTETSSTSTITETQTETSTETPAPEPQEDEDGNAVCEGDMDDDSGCSEESEVEIGTDPGFSLPENLRLNVTLTPVLIPVFRLNVSLVYAGPISSMVELPWDNDVITYVSALTSSREPGKDMTFTIHFVNESVLGRYIHMEEFIDFISGKKYVYKPTVIEIYEGYEWGERWEIHLYSTITGDSGYFILYNLTEDGLKEVQRGNVTISGASATFTIKNFSEIFPDEVYMRIEGYSTQSDTKEFTYPKGGKISVNKVEGKISYYSTAAYWEDTDKRFKGLSIETKGNGLEFRLQFSSGVAFHNTMPLTLYMDDNGDGWPEYRLVLNGLSWKLYNGYGQELGSGSGRIEQGTASFDAVYPVETLFSHITDRKFVMWIGSAQNDFRFPRKSNLYVNAYGTLKLEKDVDRYLVIVVEDVYIKENGDYREGEIQLVSWAYPYWAYEKPYWRYGPVYTFGYPVAHWVEAWDDSRILFHDPRAVGNISYPFINGYPVIAIPVEELDDYRYIILKTVAWDRDEPGSYVSKGVGFLADVAIGFATGEIGEAAKWAYDLAKASSYLTTGEGIDNTWSKVFEWIVGAEPDKVGVSSYGLQARGNYRDGVVLQVPSEDGNMLVTYVIYEVEVPRTLTRTSAEVRLEGVRFTQDTEPQADEYYFYLRACHGFSKVDDYQQIPGTKTYVTPMVPAGGAYAFPKGGTLRGSGLTDVVGDLSAFSSALCQPTSKIPRGKVLGDKLDLKFNVTFLHMEHLQVPFIYIEYQGWEEDAGNWGNDDDPMGGFGVTVLLDDDYFDWDYNYGVPHRSWGGTFRVSGVTGGKSEVTIAFSIG